MIFCFPGIQQILEATILVDVIIKQSDLTIVHHLKITDPKSATLGTSTVSQ